MSEPVFMAQIRAADIPESMPVSRAIRDFMVAHPPTPEGQPQEELLQLLMLSVMRLEGRVVSRLRRESARSCWGPVSAWAASVRLMRSLYITTDEIIPNGRAHSVRCYCRIRTCSERVKPQIGDRRRLPTPVTPPVSKETQ